MKTMKKLVGFLLILSLVLGLGVSSAFASWHDTEPTEAPENKYEGVQDPDNLVQATGTTDDCLEFDKYLVLNKGVPVPDVKFRYIISASESGDATGSAVFIKPVPAPSDYDRQHPPADASAYNVIGQPVFVGGVAFQTVGMQDPSDPNSTTPYTSYEGDTLYLTYMNGGNSIFQEETKPSSKTVFFMTVDTDPSTLPYKSSDEYYAQKTMKISFEGVTFLEPGVYRYVITEDKTYTNTQTPLPGLVFDARDQSGADGDCKRYVDVYVVDQGGLTAGTDDGKLKIEAIVMHTNSAAPTIDTYDETDNPNGNNGTNEDSGKDPTDPNFNSAYNNPGVLDPNNENELKTKSTGFSNQYDTINLAFKKQVLGNQGSRDKFFKFTVTITPPETMTDTFKNCWFEIDKMNSSWIWEPDRNVATSNDYSLEDMREANKPLPADDTNLKDLMIWDNRVFVKGEALFNGKVFYLQSGDFIRILNLPAQATYDVAELEEDYRKLPAAVDNFKNRVDGKVDETKTNNLKEEDRFSHVTGIALQDDEVGDGTVYTSYKNVRDGIIPTGLLTVVGPAVALIALAGAGFGIVLAGKRRHEDED